VALDAGADDVVALAEVYEVLTPPAKLEPVKDALAAKGIPVQSAEQTKIPSQLVPVGDPGAASVMRLLEALEDHDDVQKVYANYDMPDEVLARLTS
jgi:transcriptional/translational regulatory protein YebC/TACO1